MRGWKTCRWKLGSEDYVDAKIFCPILCLLRWFGLGKHSFLFPYHTLNFHYVFTDMANLRLNFFQLGGTRTCNPFLSHHQILKKIKNIWMARALNYIGLPPQADVRSIAQWPLGQQNTAFFTSTP